VTEIHFIVLKDKGQRGERERKEDEREREKERDGEHWRREGRRTQANEPGALLPGFSIKC
jgi:hypothetical protein